LTVRWVQRALCADPAEKLSVTKMVDMIYLASMRPEMIDSAHALRAAPAAPWVSGRGREECLPICPILFPS